MRKETNYLNKITYIIANHIKSNKTAGKKLLKSGLSLLLVFMMFFSVLPLPAKAAVPEITSISSSEGTTSEGIPSGTSAGGTQVTIKGSNFAPAGQIKVLFGEIEAKVVSVDTEGKIITVISPPYPSIGKVNITVKNFTGETVTKEDGYEYLKSSPEIEKISPTKGTAGTEITITGKQFMRDIDSKNKLLVKIGGILSTKVTFVSSTTIKAVVPLQTSGYKEIVVENPDGGIATYSPDNDSERFFYEKATPTILKIEPSKGPINTQNEITIKGTNFIAGNYDETSTPITTVTVGGQPATDVVVVDEKTITAKTPEFSTTGPRHVIVTVDGINAIKENGFTFISNPHINSLDDSPPGIAPLHGSVLGGTTININGSGFMPGAIVKLGGTRAKDIIVHGETRITATTPPYLPPGSVSVTVTNPDGGEAVLDAGFVYTQSQPEIVSISNKIDKSGPATSSVLGGETVFIKGHNFESGVKVYFAGKESPKVILEKTDTYDIIKAQTPPSSNEGLTTVRVENKDGGFAENDNNISDMQFSYIRSEPSIESFSPNSSSTVSQGEITILGSEFMDGAKVFFGGLQADDVIVSQTSEGKYQISAKIPETTTPGQVVIKVVNPDGGETVAENKFTYTKSSPKITSQTDSDEFAPINTEVESLMRAKVNTGTTVGGTPIRIEGEDFSSKVKLLIGGRSATNIKVIKESDKHIITAITPPAEAGERTVEIINPDGSTVTSTFKYVVSPTITGITPDTGTTEGGTTVVIDGSGFETNPNETKVKVFFGGVETYDVNVESSQRITVKTPRNSEGAKDVTVINTSDYGSFTKKNGFEYTLPPSNPAIEKIEPTSGSTAGGTQITVTGTDIRSGAVLTIGGKRATDVKITVDENSKKSVLTAITPPGEAGEQEVKVTNTDGNFAISPTPFTYKIPEKALALVSITPNKGSIEGGTIVTLYGANFVKDTQIEGDIFKKTKVTIGGNECSEIQVLDDLKTIRAKTPGGIEGPQDVIVKIVKVDVSQTPEKELEIESQVVLKNGFTYEIPQSEPKIDKVVIYDPITNEEIDPIGPASGGSIVRIYGENFMSKSGDKTLEVYFGDTKAAIVDVISPGLITTISPKSTRVGACDVRVVNPDGGETILPAGFIYKGNNLILTSITPNTGSVSGGTSATLTGANFIDGTQVTIGGEAALDIKVVDTTVITLTIPPNTPGLKDVVAYNKYGSYTLKNAFLYYVDQSTPTITKIDPDEGSAAGGDNIAVTGTNFMSGPNFKLLIGGNQATDVKVISPTKVTAKTPPGIPGKADVTVINDDGGTATLEKGFTYKTNPIITDVKPNRSPAKGGVFIEISGQNFMTGADVKFVGDITGQEGISLENVKVISDTKIKAIAPKIPDEKTGYVDLVITNPDKGTGKKENAFLYKEVNTNPEIHTITPNRGPVTGGVDITITGKDFMQDALVVIGDNFATDVRVIDNTTITAKTPAGKEGDCDVYVINASDGGFAVKEKGFTYMVPRSSPIITKVEPNRGSSEGGTPVTITGKDFRQNISVIIGGIEVKKSDVNLISPTEIRIKTPEAKTYGKKDVTIVNEDGGIFTLKQGFEYVPPDTIPEITDVNPTSGTIFGGTFVKITGKNFVKGVKVLFGGVEAKDVNIDETGTLITAITPEYVPGHGDTPEDGKYEVDVIAINPDGGLAIWDGKFSYVVPESRPKIIGVFPPKGPVSGGTYITIEGADFRPCAKVMIGGAEAQVVSIEDETGNMVDGEGNQQQGTSFVSGNKISAITPPQTKGKKDVRVINPDQGLAILKGGFEYIDVTGEIELFSITPTQGAVSGGTPFTIKGKGFKNPVTVYFGGVEAKMCTAIDDNTIVGRTPPNTQGKKDVVVLNGNGLSAALPKAFLYKVPDGYPKITEVEPAKGPSYGGIEVNIYGSNFKTGAIVYIGENMAEVLVADPAHIRIKLPEGSLGEKDVIVINPDTGLDILEGGFTYIDYPKIQSVEPAEGPVEGGTDITITGELFHQGAVVIIGGKAATNIQVTSETTIKAKTPANSFGYKDVMVINPDGGQAVLKDGFYYIPPRTKPDAPENLIARCYDKTTIELSWSPALNANQYEIFGSKKRSDDFSYIDKCTNTHFYVTDLEPNTKYYFKVRAVNELGVSDFSNTDSAETDRGREEKLVEVPKDKREGITSTGADVNIMDVDGLKDLSYHVKLFSKGALPYPRYTVTISYEAIRRMNRELAISAEGFNLRFTKSNLDRFGSLTNEEKEDSAIKIIIERADKAQRDYLMRFKQKEDIIVSDVINIKMECQVANEKRVIDYFSGWLEMEADYELTKKKMISSIRLCSFEPVSRKWEETTGYYHGGLPPTYYWPSGYINKSGFYGLFGR